MKGTKYLSMDVSRMCEGLHERKFCYSGILHGCVSALRSCKPTCNRETHQVNVIMLSSSVIQLSVDSVRWHHQFCSDALQKGKASREKTFLRCDIRSIASSVCEGTREGDLFGEALSTGGDIGVCGWGKFFIALWIACP